MPYYISWMKGRRKTQVTRKRKEDAVKLASYQRDQGAKKVSVRKKK